MRAMKKCVAAAAACAAVLAGCALWLCLLKVPADGDRWVEERDAFRKLGPGLHWIWPWTRATALEGREFVLSPKGTLYSCEYSPIPYAAKAAGRIASGRLGAVPPGGRLPLGFAEEALRRAILETGLSFRLEDWTDAARRGEREERLRKASAAAGLTLSRLEWQTDAGVAAKALEAKKAVLSLVRPAKAVLFIGLDAADWMILDRLMQKGKLPVLAALKARGAWGDIVSEEPMLSPILWTSIATGKRPEKHGILEFTARDAATGRDLPVTSDKRKVKALWNILSAFGRRTGILGWWATYPAEWVDGLLVSERIGYQLFGMSGAFADQPGLISPFPAVVPKPRIVRAEDITFDQVKPFVRVTGEEFDRAWEEGKKTGNLFDHPVNHLRAILASTQTLRGLTLDLLKQGRWDLLAPYFEGTDTAAHRFAQYLPPRLPWVPEGDFDRYSEALDQYYIYIDGMIGEFLRSFPPDGTVLIASDHGFKTGSSRPAANPEDMVLGAPQWHRKFGVFLLAGPGVKRGETAPVSILDLAPLVLYLQGLPLARDMDGRLPEAVFDPQTLAERPPASIATYEGPDGRPALPTGGPDAAVDERLKELQALGYIGGREVRSPSPRETAAAQEGSYTAWYNLGNAAMYRGENDRAMECFRQALKVNPSFGLAMFHLASLEARAGNHMEAVRWLEEATRVGREVPALAAVHLVDEARAVGRVPEALAHLQTIAGKYGDASAYHSAVGIALLNLGREDEAHAKFGDALRLDPADVFAIEEDLKLAARRGWSTPAEAGLKAALRDPALPFGTLRDLGKVCLRLGLLPEARAFFTRALAADDSDPELLMFAATAEHQAGRAGEAERLFRKALVAGPYDPRIHFNYGAVLANKGRGEEAYDHLKKAEQYGMRDPALYNALGTVAFRLGKREEAADYLDKSLALVPAQPEIREMLESLGRRAP